MAEKKMTIVARYEATQSLLRGEVVEDFTIEDALTFLGERAEQVRKKNTSKGGEKKLTKTQVENEGIKEQILEAITAEGKVMPVPEIMKAIGIESNQKVTSLLTQLRKANLVVRTEEKGVAYYGLPPAEDTAEE